MKCWPDLYRVGSLSAGHYEVRCSEFRAKILHYDCKEVSCVHVNVLNNLVCKATSLGLDFLQTSLITNLHDSTPNFLMLFLPLFRPLQCQ